MIGVIRCRLAAFDIHQELVKVTNSCGINKFPYAQLIVDARQSIHGNKCKQPPQKSESKLDHIPANSATST